MAIPRQGRSSSTADILAIMARLASSGVQMPNLPMVPFPQQGFGGSMGGRASGGTRSSGGGSAGSRGLTEVLRDAEGNPIQRKWGELDPKEANSLAVRLDGWVRQGNTPEQLQALVGPWNLDLSDSPYGQARVAPPPTLADHQGRLTATGSIIATLDGFGRERAEREAAVAGIEGYIWRDKARLGQKELDTKELTFKERNDRFSQIHQSVDNLSPEMLVFAKQKWIENGGDPEKFNPREMALDDVAQYEKWSTGENGGPSTAYNTEYAAEKKRQEEKIKGDADDWDKARRLELTEDYEARKLEADTQKKKDAVDEWKERQDQAQDRAYDKRFSTPAWPNDVGLAVAKGFMNKKYAKEYGKGQGIRSPQPGEQRFMGPQQQPQPPLGAPEVVGPMSAQGLMEPNPQQPPQDGSGSKGLLDFTHHQRSPQQAALQQLFAPQGGGAGQQMQLSPTEQLNAEFKEVLAANKRLVDTQGYGFSDERDTQDLDKQRKTINSLFTDAAKKKNDFGHVSDKFVNAIRDELETYNNMASQMMPQPSLQQQAEMEVYTNDDGTQFSRNADGTMGSNMGPKTSIKLETLKLQQGMQMDAQRLELDQQKLQLDAQRLQQDSQNRGEDRSQREDVELRKALLEFDKQPATIPPFPIDSPGNRAEPAINTTIDENVLPLPPQPLQGETLPNEGLLPVGPGTPPPREMDSEGQTAARAELMRSVSEKYRSDGNLFAASVMDKMIDVELLLQSKGLTFESLSKADREQLKFYGEVLRAADKGDAIQVETMQQAEQLPPGTIYVAPDGKTRKR